MDTENTNRRLNTDCFRLYGNVLKMKMLLLQYGMIAGGAAFSLARIHPLSDL